MLWVFRKIFKWYKYNIKKDQKKNIYKICNNPTKHLKYDVHTVLTNILLFGKKNLTLQYTILVKMSQVKGTFTKINANLDRFVQKSNIKQPREEYNWKVLVIITTSLNDIWAPVQTQHLP